jgi:hypothetical protein
MTSCGRTVRSSEQRGVLLLVHKEKCIQRLFLPLQ